MAFPSGARCQKSVCIYEKRLALSSVNSSQTATSCLFHRRKEQCWSALTFRSPAGSCIQIHKFAMVSYRHPLGMELHTRKRIRIRRIGRRHWGINPDSHTVRPGHHHRRLIRSWGFNHLTDSWNHPFRLLPVENFEIPTFIKLILLIIFWWWSS